MIELIVDLSDRYIYNRNQPDKAIDILDEVCAHVNLKENKQIKKYNKLNQELHEIIGLKNKAICDDNFSKATDYKKTENRLMNEINNLELSIYRDRTYQNITKKDIIEIVSRKANIPIYSINKNINDIVKLRTILKSKIIGQDNCIKELINIYKKIKLGYKDDKCFSLMFQGPSGVGKTELAKLFGNYLTNNVIKLDMSEYSEAHSISKIIGSPAGYIGYGDNLHILDKIKCNPFSILILDEVERAHSNVLNLFLSILDDGKIKDAKGNTINFNNVIIIMTSNVGYLKNNIGFTSNNKKDNLKETFSIPFINRIDNVILFNFLTKENIVKLINKKILNIKKKYKDIKIRISKNVLEEIVIESNFMQFGARKIDKIIKNKIENTIIDNILNNNKSIEIKSIKSEEVIL